MRALGDASLRAVLTLTNGMQGRSTAIQVRAASAVLTHFLKVKELAEFEPRLRELERILKARKSKP
jgi:hypothetical protein